MSVIDVAVVGGGPAGLVTALLLARRGYSVSVFEKSDWPVDKACGEGIMPLGLAILRRLGVEVQGRPFQGIRYALSDSDLPCHQAEARFAEGPGLGVRRLELSTALHKACAQQEGLTLLAGGSARLVDSSPQGMVLEAGDVTCRCSLVVGADGLHSRIRQAAGLEGGRRRFWRWGMRQHFAMAPWSEHVEVTLGDKCEAYVTPVSDREVGVAFLFSRSREATRFENLLDLFPRLRERLEGAQACSDPRSLGPLEQPVKAPCAPGVVLVGDAGGYVDASTGEGITLALAQAEQLLEFLPRHLPARLELSRDYVRARHRLSRGYRLTTYGSLALSRFPFLRRAMIGCLSRDPNLFQALLSVNMGSLPVHSFFLRDGLRFLARSVLGQ